MGADLDVAVKNQFELQELLSEFIHDEFIVNVHVNKKKRYVCAVYLCVCFFAFEEAIFDSERVSECESKCE